MGSSWEDHGLPEPSRAFREAFDGRPPTHLSRAPGRVNLIGEHTDYNGLPVFPMALAQEVRVLFRPRGDDTVRFVNGAGEFEPRSFSLSQDIPPDEPGDWGNYLKAPCQALNRRLGDLHGFDGLVTSTLPVASGLSSSSALVIAVGQALLAVNELAIPALELAGEMARAEHYTGTRGGGMAQAISLGARARHATRLEFNPLRAYETPVPPEWSFVVAHTLVRAEKTGAALEAYNSRPRECQEALSRMRGALAEEGWDDAATLTYSELITRAPVKELLRIAEGHLEGMLLERFRHVVTEALRVYEAEEAMRRGDLLTFGLLMDASHESLRDDYQVSSPELDRIVELARNAGAAGARLTGAGFGGCAVALTAPRHLDRILSELDTEYYREKRPTGSLDDVLFVAEPAQGASVVRL